MIKQLRWFSIISVAACLHAYAVENDSFEQSLQDKPYNEAREMIIAAGWTPFKAVAPPENKTAGSKYRSLPEFKDCDQFECDVAFEKSDQILEVGITFSDTVRGTGIDPKQRYVEIMTGRALKATEKQVVRSPETNIAAAKPVMTDEQCQEAPITAALFLMRAGIHEYDREFTPLWNLLNNGSYTYDKSYVQNGSCFRQYHLKGDYLGTSYDKILTGKL